MEVNELLDILYGINFSEEAREKIYEIIEGGIDWNKRHRAHDWKNYVPQPLRDYWTELSIIERLLVYFMCEQLADKEEWD